MNRRSSRSLRVENFLYEYNTILCKWLPKAKVISDDLFKSGVFYTCKRMSQKVSPLSFRLKFNRFWPSLWAVRDHNYFLYLQEDLAIRKYLLNVINNLGFGVGGLFLYRFNNKLFIKLYIQRLKFLPKQSVYILGYRAARLYYFFTRKCAKFYLQNRFLFSTKNIYNPLFHNNSLCDTKASSTVANLQQIQSNEVPIAKQSLVHTVGFTNGILEFNFVKKRFLAGVDETLFISSKDNSNFVHKQSVKLVIKNALEQFCNSKIFISIVEKAWPLESAMLLLEIILNELRYSRNSFRNVLSGIFRDVSDLRNVQGVRVNCSGRLSKTTTMAQTDWFRIGQIPLTTLKAHVDYAAGDVKTKTGLCGVKVWIFYK